jgi:hypothetical protein
VRPVLSAARLCPALAEAGQGVAAMTCDHAAYAGAGRGLGAWLIKLAIAAKSEAVIAGPTIHGTVAQGAATGAAAVHGALTQGAAATVHSSHPSVEGVVKADTGKALLQTTVTALVTAIVNDLYKKGKKDIHAQAPGVAAHGAAGGRF